MKRTAKLVSLLLALVLVVALFAGCGGGQQQPQTNTPAPAASTPTPQGNDQEVIISGGHETTEETKYADDLTLGITDVGPVYDPLNPASQGGALSYALCMMYDQLLARKVGGGYGPELATEWAPNDDYTAWTLKLRDDVFFHNGEQFTADDVKFTIDITKSTPGAVGGTKWAPVDSVEVVNDFECILHMKGKNVDLEDTLANFNCVIFNRDAYDKDPETGAQIGSGPWKLKEFKPNATFTMVRNDDYWGEKALAKTFTMKSVLEQTAMAIMFENGELDWAGTSAQYLAAYEADPNIEVDSFTTINTTYIAFNQNTEYGSDINFRKAVLYAVNRQDYNDITVQGTGHTWEMQTYWGNGTAYAKNIPAPAQDLEKAKEYLAQSCYTPGKPVKLWTTSALGVSNAQVAQQQLADIGVEVSIQEGDNASFGSQTGWGSMMYDLMTFGGPWGMLATSCSFTLQSGALGNKAQYSNPRVDELIALGEGTPNGPEREAIYYEIQDIVAEDIPYIGLFNIRNFIGRHTNCGGSIIWPDSVVDYSYAYKIIE
jgi:peptide/nickel transport system substrate-binding protein